MTNPSQSDRFDVIVIGVGAMGSATAYELARRGQKVLALERFRIPHQMGSSHGLSRIIRLAFHEGPEYVPLGRRAYDLWRRLERESGQSLLHITGSIHAGAPGSPGFDRTLRACREQGVEYELLSSPELTARHPGYRLPPQMMAIRQAQGGFLVPERCVKAFADGARGLGATVRERESVQGWRAHGGGVRVRTDRGRYEGGSLVLTAGAWSARFMPALAPVAAPLRQVVAWFETEDQDSFDPSRFPVYIVSLGGAEYYGFPEFERPGIKIGKFDLSGDPVDPDALDRRWRQRDEAELRAFARQCFPGAAGKVLNKSVCMFTNSPDGHFIIGTDPEWPQVAFAAGFSGHGFKFASAIGEIMADLATRGTTDHDIARFDPARFESGKD